MIFTLQRYIFRELLKIFILSLVALTVIMSFGIMLKPFQEYGVGPKQALHLIGYFMPITLTFVTPMAALFASSLVYGRFASDNELDACRASGVSMLTLVYPGLTLALVVSISTLLLNFYVTPAFVLRAEQSLKSNAQQILFRNLQRKGYYELPPDEKYRIYADNADMQSGWLLGVIVAETDVLGIERLIVAEKARISFNPHKGLNEVQIKAFNTYQMGVGDQGDFFVEVLPLKTEFGRLMSDSIKFKKIDQIKKIQENPLEFEPIEEKAMEICRRLSAESLGDDIRNKIRSKENSSYMLYSGTKVVEFTADNCVVTEKENLELTGNVVQVEYDVQKKKILRTATCQKAVLYFEGDQIWETTLTLELQNARWEQQDGSKGLAGRIKTGGLIYPQNLCKFDRNNLLSDIQKTLSERPHISSKLNDMQNGLSLEIKKIFLEIQAETHFRLVFGIGCVPLILIGIGLGIIKRGGHLLSAFGASSLPAVILIVCIMMGKNLIKSHEAKPLLGIALMWSGVFILFILASAIYRKLLRN